MSNQTFQKWCVFALFLTTSLWIAGALLEYLSAQFGASTALAGQWLLFAWSALLVFGLLAIYHFDLEKMGTIGFFAFASAMLGTVLKVVPEYLQLSSLTSSASAGTEITEGLSIGAVAALIFLLGYLWFGVLTFYNGSFSRWGTALFTVGICMGAIPFLVDNTPDCLPLLSAAIGGVGLAWLGLSLLHKTMPPVT